MIRLRIPEILKERSLTAHAIALQSEGRINRATLYRLARNGGRVRLLDTELLDALCEVLDMDPGEILERTVNKRRRK